MNHAPIKAILFDLDDTLWPIAPAIQRAEIVLFEWLAVNAPKVAQLHSIESLRARRMALLQENPHFRIDLWSLRHAALTEAFLASGEDAAKAGLAMTVFSQARNKVDIFKDVIPVLENLSTRVAVGSISNGVADLHMIGLAHHFRASIAAHRVGCMKPDPAIFLAGCKALGVMPAEAVYVGDDLELDIEGAQRAGLRAIWVNRTGRPATPHIFPDFTCTTFQEMEPWLTERIIVTRDNI